MTENYTVFVESTNMLSILSGADIEHPYRFQPYVHFIVSLSEYKKFVASMVSLSVSWLRFDKKNYESVLRTNNKELWSKLYLVDISKAIVSELALAVVNKEEATVILHEFDEMPMKRILLSEVDKELAGIPSSMYIKALESLKRDIKILVDFSNMSEHNTLLLHYALLLRAMCFCGSSYMLNINLIE